MRETGCYAGENPLIDIGSRLPVDLDDDYHDDRPAIMPRQQWRRSAARPKAIDG
jgi:hypothetical protein